MSTASTTPRNRETTASIRPDDAPRSGVFGPAPGATADFRPSAGVSAASIPPLRKAAIVLISLEQSLSSQMLAHLDREVVEAVTWEIARMDRVDPAEQAVVLEEFLGMGLRRLCFVFEDVLRMDDRDVRAAFRVEDAEAWALALAGSAAPVRAKVLGALSGSAAQSLNFHLTNLGPFRLSDTEVAQAEITVRFRTLYDQGAVDLPDPSGREEVLV